MEAVQPHAGTLGYELALILGDEVAARHVGSDLTGDICREGRQVARGGAAIHLRGGGQERAVLELEVPRLALDRAGECPIRDAAEGPSGAKQQQAEDLEHQVALPRVELGDDDGEDESDAGHRDGKPPVAAEHAGDDRQQPRPGGERGGPSQPAAAVERGARQDQQGSRTRGAEPDAPDGPI